MKNRIFLKITCFGLLIVLTGCKKSIEGCTSPTALNFSNKANSENGSCVEPKNTIFQTEFKVLFGPNQIEPTKELVFTGGSIEQGDLVLFEHRDSGSPGWSQFPYDREPRLYFVELPDQSNIAKFSAKWQDGDTIPMIMFIDVELNVRATLIKKELVKYAKDHDVALETLMKE